MSDVISLPPEQIEAAIARIKAEKERRLAEKVEGGEIIDMPIFIVAGSEPEALARVEEAKAAKLAELRAAGDQREVKFTVELIVTGVLRRGEATEAEPWKPRPPLPRQSTASHDAPDASHDAPETHIGRDEPQPPLVETPISVQIRACRDDDDPGEIAEGYFSVDGRYVTVTDANGRHVGSRAITAGEDPKTVAKRLLREKTPEAESFSRPLSYPNAGLA